VACQTLPAARAHGQTIRAGKLWETEPLKMNFPRLSVNMEPFPKEDLPAK
jgi:hypothetical protein